MRSTVLQTCMAMTTTPPSVTFYDSIGDVIRADAGQRLLHLIVGPGT
ncbi:hypothetical protein ACF061_37270 [Streptomyces sp. NPDC015220]